MTRLKYIFLFALAISILPVAKAQKGLFNGTITFNVSAEGDLTESTKKMIPTEMVYKFSEDKQSLSFDFAMSEQKTIFDSSTKTANILMNLLGKKFAISQNLADIENLSKNKGETQSFKETKETKTIAGFPCKKVILTRKTGNGTKIPSSIYYTEAIDVSRFKIFNTFPEVKGFPLEFSITKGGVDLKVTAKEIKKENLPASDFLIGSDFEKISFEELKKFFGSTGFLK
jgi:hypothetical protein